MLWFATGTIYIDREKDNSTTYIYQVVLEQSKDFVVKYVQFYTLLLSGTARERICLYNVCCSVNTLEFRRNSFFYCKYLDILYQSNTKKQKNEEITKTCICNKKTNWVCRFFFCFCLTVCILFHFWQLRLSVMHLCIWFGGCLHTVKKHSVEVFDCGDRRTIRCD